MGFAFVRRERLQRVISRARNHGVWNGADDGSGVNPIDDVVFDFDDIAANLQALPEEGDNVYDYADPNLLPPILAAYGPNYGASFDDPKEAAELEGSLPNPHLQSSTPANVILSPPKDDACLEAII